MRAQSGLEAERRERPNSRSVGSNSLELELERRKDLRQFARIGIIQECNSHNAIIISHCVYTRAARPARGDAH